MTVDKTTAEEVYMDLATAYATVVKYALLPNSHVNHFLTAHHNGDSAAEGALADHFVEQDDPRGEIMQRSLGFTKHPDDEEWKKLDGGLSPRGSVDADAIYIDHGDFPADGGISTVHFAPSAQVTSGPAESVYGSYWHSKRVGDLASERPYQEVHYRGQFTPDEVRGMADKLPSPHSEQVHAMLDRHFGPRG